MAKENSCKHVHSVFKSFRLSYSENNREEYRMYEYSRKEQERISALEQIDRYLIDPQDHVLRSIDGRPVMKESTIPKMITSMLICCMISIAIGVFRESTQRILMMAASAFFGFYAVRYYQYYRALKGK